MKRFTIPCTFGTIEAPFHIYVGSPRRNNHPLQHQANWLSVERGGLIPDSVRKTFELLQRVALENNVNFSDLCVFAWGNSQSPLENYNPQQFREQVLSLSKANKSASKRQANNGAPEIHLGYAGEHQWPVYAKANLESDSLLKKTYEETVQHISGIARVLWPDDKEQATASRAFFLGLAIYIAMMPGRKLTLSEIYRVMSSDDVGYSLAVALDIAGEDLPPLAYTLIIHWLRCERWIRESTVFRVTATLVDFALSTPKKEDKYRALRSGLRESMLKKAA